MLTGCITQGKGAAGGQAGASAAAAAAGSADKTRFAKAGLQAAATKASMHTVMEQDDDAHHQAHAAKAATTSPKAVTSPQPSAAAHHAAHHHAHAAAAASSSHAAQPMDATPSSAARPAPVATPQKRPADAPAPTAAPTKQPAAMQVSSKQKPLLGASQEQARAQRVGKAGRKTGAAWECACVELCSDSQPPLASR